MKGKEFGFSRLLLLVGSLFGIGAFFRPFYQIEAFYVRPSGYDIILQSLEFSEKQKSLSLDQNYINDLVLQELTTNPTYYIPLAILLVIPIIFLIVGIELFVRSFWLKLKVVQRGWIFIILSFIGVIAGYWIGQQQEVFEFYFFESVKSGYWQSLTMVVFSLLAKFVD